MKDNPLFISCVLIVWLIYWMYCWAYICMLLVLLQYLGLPHYLLVQSVCLSCLQYFFCSSTLCYNNSTTLFASTYSSICIVLCLLSPCTPPPPFVLFTLSLCFLCFFVVILHISGLAALISLYRQLSNDNKSLEEQKLLTLLWWSDICISVIHNNNDLSLHKPCLLTHP